MSKPVLWLHFVQGSPNGCTVEAHARSFSVFRTPLSSHVILPYCPLKPWHTSVLAFLLRHTSVPSSSSLAYFRSASNIQVVFSFRYKYPGRTFLLCLKAVSSSRTAVNPIASPRRSTVFQRGGGGGGHSAEHALTLDRPSGVHAQLDHVRKSEQRNIPRVPRPYASCQQKLRRFARFAL